jgi:release factor glutamine methyltransferase
MHMPRSPLPSEARARAAPHPGYTGAYGTAKLRAGAPIDSARRELTQAFRDASLETPELDARLLVGHALDLDHAALATAAARKLTQSQADAVGAAAVRRLAREPVARIIGKKEFWGLNFRLSAETLVPRPETETVVEATLAALAGGVQKALRVADLGTGSGALLLAILSELGAACGIGTDTSLAALACARANARALGMGDRAAFLNCDYGAALAGGFDLVVSNPPYIRRCEIATLAPEVRLYDPVAALDGGRDGLDGYRAIANDASRLLSPCGILVVELGIAQLAPVRSLFAAAGLTVVADRKDLSGVSRALVLRCSA